MLELPESYTITKQMNEAFQGKQIASAKANASPHGFAFYFGDPAAYSSLLTGKTVDAAYNRAGMVELALGETRLVFGDGANLRYYEAGAKLPEKHQLHLLFEDGSSLVCTIQMYGGIWAFQDGTNDNFYYRVAGEKPNPLDGAFDRGYFELLYQNAKPNLSAKAFLATEQRIPGLGNGVLQDILFRAGVHPKAKIETFSKEQREKLFQCVKETLQEMAQQGGRDTEKDLYGNPGGYRSILSKNTWQYQCPVCGGSIVRKAYLGGNVYYCPTCQPLAGEK